MEPQTEPNNFKNFKFKIKKFINQNNLDKEYENYKLEVIKSMIDEFNLLLDDDVYQLAFVLWRLQEDSQKLLNNGYLMTKIDLNYFKNQILKNKPSIKPTEFRGLTPLGGFSAQFIGSIQHYDCIKFIGQFTNSQEVYDKCLEILELMPKKLSGLLKDPHKVMFLMGFNKSVNTINNKHKDDIIAASSNEDDYYESIYSPEPNNEINYEIFHKQLDRLLDLNKKKYKSTRYGNTCYYLCLIDIFNIDHWDFYDNKNFQTRTNITIDDNSYNELGKIMTKISEIQIDKNHQQVIDNKLRFIRKCDDGDITSIMIGAYVYVTDDKYDKEILKRDLLIQLYERNLVEPNSYRSHYLMREAAERGVLWIVKFLISKGCRTKNLILHKYLDEKHDDNRQLKEILEKNKYDDTPTIIEGKKVVLKYLVENNLI